MRKKYFSLCWLLLVAISTSLQAQPPAGYYNAATGTGYTLKTQLHNIIKTGHTARQYCQLWNDFEVTDKRPDNKVWDMYSNCNFTFGTDQDNGTGGSAECQKYNREHTFPQSWFGSSIPTCGTSPVLATDLLMVYPTDKYVNARRGNLPYGNVATVNETYSNGGKRGSSSVSIPGYSGMVFEPANDYKGDLARTFFYVATRYQDQIASWETNSNESNATLNGTSDQVFELWQLQTLYQWHIQDPVSTKETNRNNAVYGIQGNRNPFIDHPEWVASIWGSALGLSNGVQFLASASSITEGNAGTQTHNITISVSPAPAAPFSVTVAVKSMGTTAGSADYSFVSPQTINFAAGETTKDISVTIVGDTDDESDETIVLELSNPTSGIPLATNTTHVLTIIDNDGAGPQPSLNFSNTTLNLKEGEKASIDLALSSPAPQNSFVKLEISSTEAQYGKDLTSVPLFVGGTASIQILQGTTGLSISFEALQDADEEPLQNFTCRIVQVGNNLQIGTSDILTISVENAAPLATESQWASQTTLFPNPASQTVQIKTPLQNYQTELLDALGRKIQSNNLNIEHLPKGVYFLKIFNQQYTIIKKLAVDK